MRKLITLALALVTHQFSYGQSFNFYPEVDFAGTPVPDTVIVPPSPLTTQILFIGGVDTVQTTDTYGNLAGQALAKQGHDFIGWSPIGRIRTTWWNRQGLNYFNHKVYRRRNQKLGWVTVNHERTISNDLIGDGGGMTTFKIKRNKKTDLLEVVKSKMKDGREGKFFNVDFANTVGETGMNCAGISAYNGRVWTAEEWFRSSNEQISSYSRDTNDVVVSGGFSGLDGSVIKKYENLNWMVEVNPKKGRAIRKQYNWGRQPFEGGVILPDNKTVYLCADATPGFFTKFVAKRAGNFKKGRTYVYKHDAPSKWVEIDNTDMDKMLNFSAEAVKVGATMFNRLEWGSFNPQDGNVYVTETGRDNPGSRWADEYADGAVFAPHHITRATDQGTTPQSEDYWDYYGRILKFDINSDDFSVFLEAGPHLPDGAPVGTYPSKHLSNPDGLAFIKVNERELMIIQEDINGTSVGRVPDGVTNRTCEMFLLDLAIEDPTIDDLVRIALVPAGAEVTGAIAIDNGKTILFNSQHPSGDNPYPYNNSITLAISGWDKVVNPEWGIFRKGEQVEENTSVSENNIKNVSKEVQMTVFPNPTSREVNFSKVTDVAIYNAQGQLVVVKRNVRNMDISNLKSGNYFLKFPEGKAKVLVIQK